ncbi:MAG TPA: hypothetical protein VMA09_15785 [Candidatus Binataceae bacterium]|nr:hypothetical protein [Candidatus Binataceae bacterium]
MRKSGAFALLGIALTFFAQAHAVLADDAAGGGSDLAAIKHEIVILKQNDQAQRKRLDDEDKLIKSLERKLQGVEGSNHDLSNKEQALEITNTHLQSETTAQLQQMEQHLSDSISPNEFDSAINRYLGTHQFTLVGGAAGEFIYDRQNAQNTFSLLFEPIFLYRLNDWILFEGSIEASLPQGSGADFELPVATAHFFLNDYMEINAGIFDQPFGDFYEDQSPVWVNRFITAPLMYGVNPIIPPTDVGMQVRGGLQWGKLGQDFDYTTWAANGPSFDSSLPEPVAGQALNGQNNIGVNTNGRAMGARFRVYPFPLDSPLGRLELGASTYDGKWQDSLWFNSWGVDFAYLNGNLQARGEFAETYRQMPAGTPSADNRQGWYVQAGYFLQGIPSVHMGDKVDDLIHRLEPLVRYSGVNQRAVVADEVPTTPSFGFSGSAAVFSPHAREVALGLDYWIAPSIVWQTEADFELPQSGGYSLTFNGAQTPTSTAVNHPQNDFALITQFAIGF